MKTSQWRRTVENRCVFSARLKALSAGPVTVVTGGRRFRVAGPLTAKQSIRLTTGYICKYKLKLVYMRKL